jgi:hypothetical protein
MSFVFFYKIREQEGRKIPACGKVVGTRERERRGERAWEGEYSANTVYTYM